MADYNTWRLCVLQRGHDLTESERRPGTVPVMGSAGIAGYHDTARAKGPGVTVGRSGVGSMGVVCYSRVAYWPHNTTLYVTDFRGNSERFVYYFLKSLNLRRFDSGSAQSSLNRNFLYPIQIRVPSVLEQETIADVLGSLDDKIELNREMNKTLEGMARTIFTSWFVNFDPVRAKAAGRQPSGMDADTAALFPSCFEDSPLGKIPHAWSMGTVGDVAAINLRSIKRDYPHEVIKYIDISSVTVGRLDGTTDCSRPGTQPCSTPRRSWRHHLVVRSPEPPLISVRPTAGGKPCRFHRLCGSDPPCRATLLPVRQPDD